MKMCCFCVLLSNVVFHFREIEKLTCIIHSTRKDNNKTLLLLIFWQRLLWTALFSLHSIRIDNAALYPALRIFFDFRGFLSTFQVLKKHILSRIYSIHWIVFTCHRNRKFCFVWKISKISTLKVLSDSISIQFKWWTIISNSRSQYMAKSSCFFMSFSPLSRPQMEFFLESCTLCK